MGKARQTEQVSWKRTC